LSVAEELGFFAAVSPPAPVLVAVLGILAAGAIVIETISAGGSDWVLASILLVQLFAVATGFFRHATRGYYDPILLGSSRPRVAIAHFAVSAAPGLAAWIVTGGAEAVAARSLAVPALRAPGWVALLLASALPWAAGVRAPRFAPAILWLLVTASLLVSGVLLPPLTAIHSDPGWAARHALRSIGVALAFPMIVPTLQWPAPVLLALAGIAALAVLLGVAGIVAGDYPTSEEGT
jgi:hypothetical protein